MIFGNVTIDLLVLTTEPEGEMEPAGASGGMEPAGNTGV